MVGRRDLRPEGLGDLGHHPRLLRGAAAARSTWCSTTTTSCRSTALLRRRHRHRLELAAGLARRAAPLRRRAAARSPCATPTAIASRTSSCGADGAGAARSRICAGRTVAVGAKDSPQATLIPLGLLQRHGLEPGARRHGPALRRAGRQARRPRRRRARRASAASSAARRTPAPCST